MISATIRNHGGGDHAPSFPNLNYFLHTNIRYVTVQKVRYTYAVNIPFSSASILTGSARYRLLSRFIPWSGWK